MTDLVIIGTGPAGITIANEFAGSGTRVVVLEGGGLIPTEESIDVYRADVVGWPTSNPAAIRARYLGGTSNMWTGHCRPFESVDFENRAGIPYGGWPITRDELDPFYERAHAVCQLGPYEFNVAEWSERSGLEPLDLDDSLIETKLSQQFLKLKDLPKRIEVYDNSHTFGKQSVGVMIVVDQEGLSPKHYRKYNIRYDLKNKVNSKSDDYYMMKEVLNRRFKNYNQNNLILPSVIIIDGGRGQFNTVDEVLKNNKIKSIPIISISKGKNRNAGREIIHTSERNVNLKNNDPLLHFMQRIRDEAHRFAITAHRARRKYKTLQSVFDDIPGIGPKRKKTLFEHFGTFEKIKNAKLNQLKSVKKLSNKVAIQLYDFFNSQ